MREIAIFDMDRTITKHGTYTAFLLFAATRRQRWRLLLAPLLILALASAGLGFLSRKTYKQTGFRLMIGASIEEAALSSLAQAFAARVLASNIHAAAPRQLAAERQRNSIIVMATASPDFYAAQLGTLLGVDEVIATIQTHNAGRYGATIAGANCYGEEKLSRIRAWMAKSGHDRATSNIRFYSDHISDAPIFAWADDAIAVRPDRKLRTLAEQRKWQIVDQS
jgi:HAD superfamily hydrolase (TIGR01490 family)